MTLSRTSEYAKREAALDRINDDPAWAQRAYGAPGISETHVDRVAIDPLSSSYQDGRLLDRFPSKDDPAIGAQERDGWATYVYISTPHTMDECPFDAEGKRR